MDKTGKEKYNGAFLAFFITAVLVSAAPYIPIVAVAVPFVLVYTVVKYGYLWGGAASVLGFIVGCLVSVPTSCILAAAFLPVAFITAYAIRGKKRFRDSIMASAAAALAGIALAIGALQLFTGMSFIDFAVAYIGDTLKLFDDAYIQSLYQTVRYADILSGAITQAAVTATPAAEAITTMQDIFRQWLNLVFVGDIIIYALVGGYLYYVIPRAIAKKRKMQVAAIPAFSDYTLPKRFWLAYIVSYLFAAIGASYGWPSFDILELTIYNVYAVIFIVQGLCLLDFLYKTRKVGPGVRIVLHVLATMILSGLLVWVGLFENIVGMRKRMKGGIIG